MGTVAGCWPRAPEQGWTQRSRLAPRTRRGQSSHPRRDALAKLPRLASGDKGSCHRCSAGMTPHVRERSASGWLRRPAQGVPPARSSTRSLAASPAARQSEDGKATSARGAIMVVAPALSRWSAMPLRPDFRGGGFLDQLLLAVVETQGAWRLRRETHDSVGCYLATWLPARIRDRSSVISGGSGAARVIVLRVAGWTKVIS